MRAQNTQWLNIRLVKIFLVLSAALLITLRLPAQTREGATRDFYDSSPAWMSQSKVPVLGIGIIENAVLKEVKMFGKLENGAPAPDNTLFNVASLTKPVVAVTALKLVEDGLLNLDEPLEAYWTDPDIKNDPRHKKLTPRIILSHQTGFPNWREGKLAFRFEPGTEYGYSGEGFEYLRRALEHKFGRSLQQLSDFLLFKPLGMMDTKYGWSKNMDIGRFALPHDTNGDLIDIPMRESPNAADWLVTTVGDYATFGAYVLQGAGLAEHLLTDMSTPQHPLGGTQSAMGLGWGIIQELSNGEYALVHTGHDPGVSTIIVLLPKSGRGLVLLTNADRAKELFTHILKASLQIEI